MMGKPTENPRSDIEEIVHLNQRLRMMEAELKMEQILRRNAEEVTKQLHESLQELTCVATKANADSQQLLGLLLDEQRKSPRGVSL